MPRLLPANQHEQCGVVHNRPTVSDMISLYSVAHKQLIFFPRITCVLIQFKSKFMTFGMLVLTGSCELAPLVLILSLVACWSFPLTNNTNNKKGYTLCVDYNSTWQSWLKASREINEYAVFPFFTVYPSWSTNKQGPGKPYHSAAALPGRDLWETEQQPCSHQAACE